MADELYQQLREQVDQYACGFPATDSGVEIKILKKLFTEEEARMYLNLSMEPESAEMIAKRLSRDLRSVSDLLEKMFKKGLLFRSGVNGEFHYSAAPFIDGFYNNQSKTMDKEFAELNEQYFKEAYFDQFIKVPLRLARILPANKALDTRQRISSFEEARDFIMTQDSFSVKDCMCRLHMVKLDKPCDKQLLGVCLSFGWYADYLIDLGLARRITREDALEIQKQSDEAGLVTLSGNVSDPIVFCHCCPCCCLALRSFLVQDHPAEHTCSNYYAEADPDSCVACGVCVDRCPMKAISIGQDDVAVVSRDRCIGCGLCVVGCEFEAVKLRLKPEEEREGEPKDSMQFGIELAQARGKKLTPLFAKSVGSTL